MVKFFERFLVISTQEHGGKSILEAILMVNLLLTSVDHGLCPLKALCKDVSKENVPNPIILAI